MHPLCWEHCPKHEIQWWKDRHCPFFQGPSVLTVSFSYILPAFPLSSSFNINVPQNSLLESSLSLSYYPRALVLTYMKGLPNQYSKLRLFGLLAKDSRPSIYWPQHCYFYFLTFSCILYAPPTYKGSISAFLFCFVLICFVHWCLGSVYNSIWYTVGTQ